MAVSLVGIVVTGAAGMSKEREMSEEQKKAAVAEFNFTKGILVAIFSGVMSAGMNIGISIGDVGGRRSRSSRWHQDDRAGHARRLWQGLPGAGGRAAGRLYGQFRLVPAPER